jgi:hypothetical protein
VPGFFVDQILFYRLPSHSSPSQGRPIDNR